MCFPRHSHKLSSTVSFASFDPAAEATERRLRGAASAADDAARSLQAVATDDGDGRSSRSFRAPITKNIVDTDAGGDGASVWPFGRFPSAPALNKFSFDYTNGDRNFDGVRVQNSARESSVTFKDQSRNDAFKYSVTGVELPPGSELRTFRRSNAVGCFSSSQQSGPPGKVPLLQSFSVDFANGDRNIDHIEIRVRLAPRSTSTIVDVCLSDNSFDDAYSLSVTYALVDKDHVLSLSESGCRNNIHSAAAGSATCTGGGFYR